MVLRKKLIILRDKAGISQMALAQQLGVSRQAVSRWESGDAIPAIDNLKALASIYDVSLDWLCSDTVDTNDPDFIPMPVSELEQKKEVVVDEGKDTKKQRKARYFVALIVIAVIVFACICGAKGIAKMKDAAKDKTQIENMEQDIVEILDENGFDFEWKE